MQPKIVYDHQKIRAKQSQKVKNMIVCLSQNFSPKYNITQTQIQIQNKSYKLQNKHAWFLKTWANTTSRHEQK